MRGRRGGAAVAALLMLATACGGGDAETPDAVETLTPAPTEESDGEDDVPAEGGDDHEAFAIADAAERAGVDRAEVTVVVDEQVTWPDGSLGCPQPDQFYTQALVEGYRVVVEAGRQEYHYHGQTGQPPAYCANPAPPVDDSGGVVDR